MMSEIAPGRAASAARAQTEPPLIMVAANQAWNLVHFRGALIEALVAAGYRVMAVAPADPEMEQRLAALGCSFAAVPIDPAGLSPRRDLASLLAFYRLIRQHRPVAWLSWTIKPNVYGSWAAARCGVAALPNVSGLGTAFIRRNLLTRLVKLLYRTGLARAATVFFQNEDDRALFLAMRLVRPGQARLLPGSGIDAAHFAPQDDHRPPAGRFLLVARLLADKGVREYVAAARLLGPRWPQARFHLMGQVDVANRTAIGAGELASWVAAGVIDYSPPCNDIRPAMREADFIVLPSYREGLSRVLLEAAAMRRPIVTTDVPGCRDIVDDGINGYLCEARDGPALAQALERALKTDDATWQGMAQAGRARVLAQFSQDRVIALYRSALVEAGVASPSVPELSPLQLPDLILEDPPRAADHVRGWPTTI